MALTHFFSKQSTAKVKTFFTGFLKMYVEKMAVCGNGSVEKCRKTAVFQQKVMVLWKNHAKKRACEYREQNLKKVAKKVKKSVDKWNWFWYYVKALERAAPKNRLMTGREKALCKLNNDHENKEP